VGSLVSKSLMLFSWSKTSASWKKASFVLVGAVALFFVAASLIYNMYFITLFSTADYLLLRVEPTVNLGYSLFNSTPITQNSPLTAFQYIGFAVALSGLVWLGRNKLKHSLKSQE
jgi:hypothetical protein